MDKIGHNSVQIPHDGKIVGGAKFKAGGFEKPKPKSFFRGTTMSIAMAEAGIIPAAHIIAETANTARVRHRNDNKNQRPSAHVAF